MTPEERSQLWEIIYRAQQALERWLDQPGHELLPEDPLAQRFGELEGFSAEIGPDPSDPMQESLRELASAWRTFLLRQQQTGDPYLPPPPQLWSAWQRLYRLARQQQLPRFRQIEPISELLAQKVPRDQICRIYGFLTEDGFPDYRKLDEEIARPGTHTGEGWQAPVNRHIAAVREAARQQDDALDERLAAKLAAVPVASESIEELVASGVAAVQIARLKGLTVEEVYAWCDQANVPRPPHDYAHVLQQPGAYDRPLSDQRQRMLDALQPGPPEEPVLPPPQAAPAGGEEKPRRKR